MIKTCGNCGIEYQTSDSGRKYCSRKCSGEAQQTKTSGRCEICGVLFVARAGATYCSRKCRYLSQVTRVPKSCDICGKSFSVKLAVHKLGRGKYCSTDCFHKSRIGVYVGENHWNWKGGATPKSLIDRRGIKYKDWRKSVFTRDNWTCQDCGARCGCGKRIELHAHHLFPFADYSEHRFEVWNGKTLCKDCHYQLHTKKVAV